MLTVPGYRWTDDKGSFRAVLRTNSVTTLEAAVRAGLGIGLLPDISAVRDPDLVPLPGLGVHLDATLWVVMHKDLADVARVRVVVEFLEERFADPLFHQVT